ncbi:hypothetical protein WN51_04428 [Melipona quadrifasciata]|uniref:Uncharacterized protein n=1 Tax=Melipona quadrifasciata TaxID=166423 RepID=A0A0M8ZRZ3_9HYME|nr:hypothetical protein WN51_04428 [Melipona quadrifasciata]
MPKIRGAVRFLDQVEVRGCKLGLALADTVPPKGDRNEGRTEVREGEGEGEGEGKTSGGVKRESQTDGEGTANLQEESIKVN